MLNAMQAMWKRRKERVIVDLKSKETYRLGSRLLLETLAVLSHCVSHRRQQMEVSGNGAKFKADLSSALV